MHEAIESSIYPPIFFSFYFGAIIIMHEDNVSLSLSLFDSKEGKIPFGISNM